jgi:hypothetical protein
MSQVADYRPSQEEVNQLYCQVKRLCKNGKKCRVHLQGRCWWLHPEDILRDPTLSPWVKDTLWSLAKTHPAEFEHSFQMGSHDEWHHRLPDQVRAIVTAAGGVAPPGYHSAVPTAPAPVSGGAAHQR